MFPLSSPSRWQDLVRESFHDINALADFLEWDSLVRSKGIKRKTFPLLLPRRLAEKIQKNTLDDPLLKQFVPNLEEAEEDEGFVLDPVQDLTFQKEEKLLKKYAGRALLVMTSACAMHCRYCFRQNFPYSKTVGFEKELEAIKADPSIEEIILSGGDPLSLPNRVLDTFFSEAEKLPTLRRVRIHTRFPIGIPERIDSEFLDMIGRFSKQLYVVVHINHPRELDADVLKALKALRMKGAVLLNQSVLLRGVNDHADTLAELSRQLVNEGILPYYLHQLDPVQGSSRFHVEIDRGKELIHSLTNELSGYAVPRYVKEIPGRMSKTPL